MADSSAANSKDTSQLNCKKFKIHPLLKKIMRQILIFIVSLSIVVGVFVFIIYTMYEKFFMPVDPGNDTPITIEVPMGTSVNGIAKILYENKLIRNTGAFKLMVDLSDKANDMQAGKYELSQNMTLNEIIDELMTGQVSVTTVLATIREGDDIRKIASRLVNEYNMNFTEEEFIKEARNIEKYENDFPFLKTIPEERRKLEFPMEGYLFPDTYYFFADSTPERIIRTLLSEFEDSFSSEMQQKADEMGMTMDEVVILASIIQNEAKPEEFTKVSAVFHNRLRIGMPLQADATINYILPDREVNQVNLTTEDTKIQSPYNTYLVEKLPIGPISSPGLEAMEAVLNPYEEYMNEDEPMLYYVLIDPEIGLHAFNSTYEAHIRDKNKYQANWE